MDISLKRDVYSVDFGCGVLRDCTGNTVLLDGREDQSPMEKFIRVLSVIRYQTVYTPRSTYKYDYHRGGLIAKSCIITV